MDSYWSKFGHILDIANGQWLSSCPEEAQFTPTPVGHGNARPKSRLCPVSVHVQDLSNICPISQYLFQNPKIWNQSLKKGSSKSVQCLSREKNCSFSTWLDKPLTISGFAFPFYVQVFLNWTEVGQGSDSTWLLSWQTFDMTCFWTVLGLGLDRDWTVSGFCVQYPTNQPKGTGTQKTIIKNATRLQFLTKDLYNPLMLWYFLWLFHLITPFHLIQPL